MAEAVLAVAAVGAGLAALAFALRCRGLGRRLHRQQEALAASAARRTEVEERSVATRARLAAALDTIPQGVLIVDPTGSTIYANSVASAFETARHGDALVAAAIEEVLAEALAGRSERRTVELFGPPKRALVITAGPLAVGDDHLGALAVVDDVSERRRVDEMRRDFVANISHELKTPVGAISLLAETLLAEDDIEVTQRLAGRIVDEAGRVGRTIDDLLELSRIESAEAPRVEHVAVVDVVADAVARIRPAAEHAGIPVQVGAIDPGLAVVGDRRQITSALSNLLDNAIKYSDAGSEVEVHAHGDGDVAAIAVADHGIGIPARDVERIFERFYRVDQARSRQTGGTGLGLAIVRHVASNHNGDVQVASRLGEGSTFTLRLPSAPADATDTGAHHEPGNNPTTGAPTSIHQLSRKAG